MSLHNFTYACAALAFVAAFSSPAAALDRHVKIINETSFDIVEFYGSNTGTNDWEEDILGKDVLYSGNSVNVNFDDGSGYCMFDFRAVFSDGDVLVRRKINVCEIGTYRYHE
jgi:hypothetical protein